MRAKLAFVAAQAGTHSIRFLCRALGVARSWYHSLQHARPTEPSALQDVPRL
ncbi:MAG: hypothetical protein AAGE90_16135 [Pseudomonadota bacterium]